MEDTLTEALNSYYKLKHTYDTNVLKLKRSILQDKSLSKTLMKQKVVRIKIEMCFLQSIRWNVILTTWYQVNRQM